MEKKKQIGEMRFQKSVDRLSRLFASLYGAYWIATGRFSPLDIGVAVGGGGFLFVFEEKSFHLIVREKGILLGENLNQLQSFDRTVLHGFGLLPDERREWEENRDRKGNGFMGE